MDHADSLRHRGNRATPHVSQVTPGKSQWYFDVAPAIDVYVHVFTAFDTQNIIEEYRAGSRDFLRHSFDMFINFMMIFRRMLALLMMNRD